MPCNDVTIKVENVVKKFRLFGHPGDRIKQALTLGYVKYHKNFTSLQDVSFEILKGETVGVIGRNGSGKSTLLQIICGTLKPTSGKVSVNGSIAALLELGSGFNPEFTGRENVYFQGAVMGYSRAEIDKRFTQIVEFADIGDFIDHPVRIYSSGMFVRLAFSAMVHTDADILVIDEALAVGDEAFQRKCVDKLADYLEGNDKILLYVSHNVRQIERICSKVVWLENGCIKRIGEPASVCSEYQNKNLGYHHNLISVQKPRPNIAYSGEVDVNGVSLHKMSDDAVIDEIEIHSAIKIVLELECNAEVKNSEIIVGIHTTDSVLPVSASTAVMTESPSFSPGTHRVECHFTDIMLLPGVYQLKVAIFDGFRRRLWWGNGMCTFRVVIPPGSSQRISEGVVALPFSWKLAV